MKIKLYTCVSAATDYIGLDQIITYWEKQGYIERILIPMKKDHRFISWVGRIGGLAIEPSCVDYISDKYEYVLACQYRSAWKNNNKILPWNFYVRSWSSYEEVKKEFPIKKSIKSIFSGTIRGNRHDRNKWINSTEIFSYRPARRYTRTNFLFPTLKEYYRALAKTKYGLCPVGDVSVCQRETETMGMGCVPIFTPGVEWDYYVPPKENVHFIFANTPEEMNKKIDEITENDRIELARNGMEYFEKYCSPSGLWNSVLENIEKYNIKIN